MRFLLTWTFLFAFFSPALAQTVRLPVTQDNSIVLNDGEWNENAGQQARIRAKGNQHLIAMSFDTNAIRGKLVKRATLVCWPSDQSIQGVTISTIATPWDENRSTGLTAGLPDIEAWGYAGARFPAVCGGNSHTLVCHSLTRVIDGQYHWDVAPDLVHALAIGIAHGLAIHEHDADYGRNPTIFSREQSGKQPYLLVELDSTDVPAPMPPTDLRIDYSTGSDPTLNLRAPEAGFAYEVLVNGQALGRHNIPLVEPGKDQQIALRDLNGSMPEFGVPDYPKLAVRVQTLNRQGARSEPVVDQARQAQRTAVSCPNVVFAQPVEQPHPDVAVLPVCDKYDDQGRGVGNLKPEARTNNSLYDGQTIRLFAAAGEVVGFQVLIRGTKSAEVSIKFPTISPRVDMWRGVAVSSPAGKLVDPLVPLPKTLPLSADRDEVVVVDLYVPFEQKAGRHRGTLAIAADRELPIELVVLPFALPREATFLCEMNSYGLPDEVRQYQDLQQIAYDHRVHCNILHYSHHTAAPGARKSNLDMRLLSGRRMDNKRYDNIQPGATTAYWNDFQEAFAPVLDGSIFRTGHRGPLAVPGFYLTFHESWPLNCRQYFNGNPDAYQAFDDPAYATTYVNVLKSFVELAAANQWTDAGFQVYFNNKGSVQELTKSPWILDEPSSYWDYRALRYYGELTDQAVRSGSLSNVRYRIDISRLEFCRGQLDGRSDLWIVASSAFQNYRRLVTDRMQQDGLVVWVYGTANHVHEPNRNLQAWALDAWSSGATGLVPWQTVDKSGAAMKSADQLGLFIFDQGSDGQPVIRHSLRLKAFREAQLLIEYLTLLKAKQQWNHDQLSRFIRHYVPLKASVTKLNEADAGTTNYADISGHDLDRLKRAAAMLLVN